LHDVIPRPLVNYVRAHPNATPDELMAFARQQDPQYAREFLNGAELLDVVRNRQIGVLENALDFVQLGVRHILSGPDHILFVLSLLLVYLGLREILKLTLTFTIAHSITLLLAGAGIIRLSPRITEPLIALSIVYVALATVFFAKSKFVGGERGKVASVFVFGLFHGLGFAGLLTEIQVPDDKFVSSLLSFNVGIELGQILIISAALPFIMYGANRRWYPTLIRASAVAIALLAFCWTVQRLFFTQG